MVLSDATICINRIRLEFKGNDAAKRLSKRYSINRIRLEFKVELGTNDINGYTVLIESDWNLKWS